MTLNCYLNLITTQLPEHSFTWELKSEIEAYFRFDFQETLNNNSPEPDYCKEVIRQYPLEIADQYLEHDCLSGTIVKL